MTDAIQNQTKLVLDALEPPVLPKDLKTIFEIIVPKDKDRSQTSKIVRNVVSILSLEEIIEQVINPSTENGFYD
eukprot:UN12350